jgi:hypothetical protein
MHLAERGVVAAFRPSENPPPRSPESCRAAALSGSGKITSCLTERAAWSDVRRLLRALPNLKRYSAGEMGPTVRLTTLGDLTFVAVSAEQFAGGVVGFLATTLLPGELHDRQRLSAYVAVPYGRGALITGRGLLPDPLGDDFRLPVYRCSTELVGIS